MQPYSSIKVELGLGLLVSCYASPPGPFGPSSGTARLRKRPTAPGRGYRPSRTSSFLCRSGRHKQAASQSCCALGNGIDTSSGERHACFSCTANLRSARLAAAAYLQPSLHNSSNYASRPQARAKPTPQKS